MSKQINVALIGNPNTGKTSVFNALTGLNQKVGNYPGITVDKKQGVCKLERGVKAHIIDLPGTYSLNASSLDESVVIELLLNKKDKDYPDVAVVITDVENLKRNLLIYTQIKDLEIPTILVINMSDRMVYKGISLDIEYLEQQLDTKIALVSTRKNNGIDELKQLISNYKTLSNKPCLHTQDIDKTYFEGLKKAFPNQSLYKLWLVITQDVNFGKIDRNLIEDTSNFKTKSESDLKRLQQKETIKRYQFINNVLKKGQTIDLKSAKDLRIKLDRILTHKIWGYLIFFGILLLMFQAVYDWATYPTDLIDAGFSSLADWVKNTLPEGAFTNLLAEGIIAGLGGIMVFIPPIAFLFLFIALLEESGYMSRVVFLMDNIMKRFGLSGKSVVPLISGNACAIPAVMAARNIESWKERLITILVTPFTTCSARLPVYVIIIALVIPDGSFLGISYQALTLMCLYIIGFLTAIFSAYILNKILKIKSKSYFVVEMPSYKIPLFKNVVLTVVEKTKTFVFEAGKIILAISIVLWFLASYGPGEQFNDAENIIQNTYPNLSLEAQNDLIAEHKLEHSYIGIIGKTIEPAIKPLGYDWKIGIGLVTSFAAREVFVGTLATIYSIGSANDIDDEDEAMSTIKNRMAEEVYSDGSKVFTLASGISLLLFYAFAMQCMSTLAIVKRETNSWKWPMLQLVFMSGFAYIVAMIAFQILK
ncbi:ferrous iron transport protein B [Winogradskyella haliclonae]|uniref:Ferrous iron transport protein B n=1 Tax=Winogradskyella haliclonae TaxID=2048558 RepID=A0ABQ2BWC9_9FLAO|nr:ferrous iron transport protein B [Winogradskyella haliclonae]GGI56394.1 ferrous iron transport protein B [Winogradskyella haliclonae]